MIVRRAFSLDDEKDKDILGHLDLLAGEGKASEFIREAIRLAMNEQQVTLSTILAEIREIKRNGVVADDSSNGMVSEPGDIVANLEHLGL